MPRRIALTLLVMAIAGTAAAKPAKQRTKRQRAQEQSRWEEKQLRKAEDPDCVGRSIRRRQERARPLAEEQRAVYQRTMDAVYHALPEIEGYQKRYVEIPIPEIGEVVEGDTSKDKLPFPRDMKLEVVYARPPLPEVAVEKIRLEITAVGYYESVYELLMTEGFDRDRRSPLVVCDGGKKGKWKGTPPVRCLEIAVDPDSENREKVLEALDLEVLENVLVDDRKRALGR